MTLFSKLTLGLSACALLTASPLQAADWPQWGGPARDNISTETGLLKTWPANGPALAWKATGLGDGLSGISVADGRIFTMGDSPDGGYVRAIDAATGKLLWSAKVGAIGGGGGFPGPRSTPTVDGKQLYALGQFGDLVCLETTTGKELWRTNLEKNLGGKMMSGWGYAESPLVVDDKLICTPGGSLGTMIALNKNTGAPLWRTTEWTDNAPYISPILTTLGGVRQVIQLTEQNLAGIAPATGKVLWLSARPGKTALATTPVVEGNLIYVTSGYNIGCDLFQIDNAAGSFTAKKIYSNKEMTNQHGGVVKIGANIFGYSDAKGWACQDLKTGNLLWADKERLGKGSLTVADGMLYLRLEKEKGTVVLLEPSTTGWSEKGRFDQPDRSAKNSWPHPVVANGRLYLRDQDTLLAYDLKAK